MYLSLDIHIYVCIYHPTFAKKIYRNSKRKLHFYNPTRFPFGFLKSPLYLLFIYYLFLANWLSLCVLYVRFSSFRFFGFVSGIFVGLLYFLCPFFWDLNFLLTIFPPHVAQVRRCSLGKVKFIMWIVVFKDKFYGFLVDSREPTA